MVKGRLLGVLGVAVSLAGCSSAPTARALVDTPHTNPADALETARKAGTATAAVEIFDGTHVISAGVQRLELHAIAGIPHVQPKVVAYAPTTRVLFQSDLFFPGTGGAASPDAVALLSAVRMLDLKVDTNVGGHGGVGPFAELVKAVAAPTPTN